MRKLHLQNPPVCPSPSPIPSLVVLGPVAALLLLTRRPGWQGRRDDRSLSISAGSSLPRHSRIAGSCTGQLSSEATAPASCCLCSAFAQESALLQVTLLSEWSSKPKGPCPDLAHGVTQGSFPLSTPSLSFPLSVNDGNLGIPKADGHQEWRN